MVTSEYGFSAVSQFQIIKRECYCGGVLESNGLLLREKSMAGWMFNRKKDSLMDGLFRDTLAVSRCTFRIYAIAKDAQFDILIGVSTR